MVGCVIFDGIYCKLKGKPKGLFNVTESNENWMEFVSVSWSKQTIFFPLFGSFGLLFDRRSHNAPSRLKCTNINNNQTNLTKSKRNPHKNYLLISDENLLILFQLDVTFGLWQSRKKEVLDSS